VNGCTEKGQIRNKERGPTKGVTDICITGKITGPEEQYLAHPARMEDDRTSK
jgi:hypothetical protein